MFVVDEYDAYIIVSFVNATLVLSIGETVEEVTDSGFLGTTPTLGCSALGDNTLLQVRVVFVRFLVSSHVNVHFLFRCILREFVISVRTDASMSGSLRANEPLRDVL